MSDNIDNLLGDIYSSSSQSQGVKELANLINNLSQLLLKAISQLEGRVSKIEQQLGGGSAPRPRTPPPPPQQKATKHATPPAPKPKVASPFGAPTPTPARPTPAPPPVTTAKPKAAPDPAPAAQGTGHASDEEADSMLGVTLKFNTKSEQAEDGNDCLFFFENVAPFYLETGNYEDVLRLTFRSVDWVDQYRMLSI